MSFNCSSKDPPGEEVAITCDALCSLGNAHQEPRTIDVLAPARIASHDNSSKFCAKQFQLPMFLSKTYHMIERCEPDIASWSEAGDNFVVKNVDKFANLNFYGFRKLRPDTILTTDLDPSTANHVRFYHQHFHRDKPELLQNIKRATTKGCEQSKDDNETLRQEISKLREELANRTADFNQKIAELSYDCNRRISALSTELEKLHNVVKNPTQGTSHHIFATGTPGQIVLLPTLAQGQNQPVQMHLANAGDLFQSLSQAATVTLQQESDKKRLAEDDTNERNGKASKNH